MLVLSRKLGEEIMIGNDIKLVVTNIDRNRVRIAVITPKEVPVFRAELLEEQADGSFRLKVR